MPRASSSRSSRPRSSKPRSPWRRRIVVTLQVLIGLAVLAVGALVIAVFVAKSQLPSFE